MKQTGTYCSVSCKYDIDQEITKAIEEARKTISDLKDLAETYSDAKALLKAVATEYIEAI